MEQDVSEVDIDGNWTTTSEAFTAKGDFSVEAIRAFAQAQQLALGLFWLAYSVMDALCDPTELRQAADSLVIR